MDGTALVAVLLVAAALGLVATWVGMKARRRYKRRRREERFLARFVAPNVLRMIRAHGLGESLRVRAADVTVVSCDLRGFTRYTQTHPSEYALQLLRDYYKVIGRIAASCGGTVKDLVGDGALIVVGAPEPMARHADAGLLLACLLRQEVERMLTRWSPRLHRLGVGIGVASGPVQAAVINSDARYEYVAVGSAVNVASRLCDSADAGQILVAPCTAAQATHWQRRLSPGPEVVMKGMDGTLQSLQLAAAECQPPGGMKLAA